MSDDDLLTVDAAALLLGVTPRQVHRYGETGRLQRQQRGRRAMYRRAEVERLAAELAATRPAEPRRRVEMMPAGEMIAYMRERDRDLAEQQRKLETALIEVGRLRGELDRRVLPGDVEDLRSELASVKAERDTLRAQLAAGGRARALLLLLALAGLLALLLAAALLFFR
jgi:predicted transcriptional regulator